MRCTRREALTFAAAAACAPAAPAALAASTDAGRRFDPDDRAAVRRAYRRMRFSTAPEPFYWWMRGVRYALIDNRPEPLFEMHVGTLMRCRDLDGGRFAVTSIEVVFNTDLEGGRLVERWRNPYTGEDLELRPTPVGPVTIEYSPDGARTPPALPGSHIESSATVRRPVVVGDDVWIASEDRATVTPDAGGRPFRVADLATYRSRLSEVLDPAVRLVECDVTYNDVTDWPRWMRMGDRPGTRFARAAGRKTAAFAGMPERWRELLAERFPAIAKAPEGALDLPPFRFER